MKCLGVEDQDPGSGSEKCLFGFDVGWMMKKKSRRQRWSIRERWDMLSSCSNSCRLNRSDSAKKLGRTSAEFGESRPSAT